MIVNLHLVSRHVEDAAFLWTQRHAALRTSRLSAVERARLDMRLQANIEGAWLAFDPALDMAIEAFERRPQSGNVFAWAVLALSDAKPPRA
jgi:hypothetical protein